MKLGARYLWGFHPELTYLEPAILHYWPFHGRTPPETQYNVNLYGWRGERPAVATGSVIGMLHRDWLLPGAQVARAAQNDVINPSLELALAPWAIGGTLDLVERSYLEARYGNYGLRVYEAASAGAGEYAFFPTTAVGTALPAVPYFFCCRAIQSVMDAGKFGFMRIQFRNAAGGTIQNFDTLFEVGQYTDWRLSGRQVTSPALTSRFSSLFVGPAGVGPFVYEMYGDSFMLCQGYATPYLDGSLGAGHAWVGAAHNSVSTRSLSDLRYALPALPVRNFTVSFWVDPARLPSDVIPTAGYLFQLLESGAVGEVSLQYNSAAGGRLDYLYSLDGGANTINAGAATWVRGIPHHVAVTHGINTARVYIDGVLAGSTTFGTPIYSGTADLGIGCDAASAGFVVDGTIFDFAIFSKELSALEISTIAGLGGPIGVLESDVYWKGAELWRPTYPASAP